LDLQIDISDDGYLSLMTSDGDTKDDVRLPDGEVGEKIKKLFKEEEKETRKFQLAFVLNNAANSGTSRHRPDCHG
jgi:hypothetical protein